MPKNFLQNRWVNWHTTTTHHDLHHKHFNGNYGLYFTWRDRWCGTERPEYRQTFEEVTSRHEAPETEMEPAKSWLSGGLAKAIKTLFCTILLANTAAAQSPVGNWQTIDDGTGKPRSLVRIVEKGGGLEGSVTKIFLEANEPPDPVCSKCTGEWKNAKIVGMNFLWGFKKDGKDWTGGSILDPANGKTYCCSMWLTDAT